MKKLTMSWLLWLCAVVAWGQTVSINDLPGNTIYEKNAYFYQQLSRTKMTTNILADKGLHLIDPRPYNGNSNAPSLDAYGLSLLYQMLYHGRNNKTPFNITEPNKLAEVYEQWENTFNDQPPKIIQPEGEIIPLTLLLANYDKLYEDESLPDNMTDTEEWFTVENGQLIDGTSAINPYLTYTLCAMAPFTNQLGAENWFVLPSEALISNFNNIANATFSIDFGNGQGYRAIETDEPIFVSFSNLEEVQAQLKVELNNTTYYANFLLNVSGTNVATSTAKDNLPDGNNWNDPKSDAVAYHYLRDNNNGTLVRPVIMVEGIDATDFFGRDRLFSSLNDGGINSEGLAERLNEAGYPRSRANPFACLTI